jgi:hypothetical protein
MNAPLSAGGGSSRRQSSANVTRECNVRAFEYSRDALPSIA